MRFPEKLNSGSDDLYVYVNYNYIHVKQNGKDFNQDSVWMAVLSSGSGKKWKIP